MSTDPLGEDVEALAEAGHDFVGVAGHPDDDECTHRADGTDTTYCGRTSAEHESDAHSGHHPKCYQSTGVPDDLPEGLCDCRILRMLDAQSDWLAAHDAQVRADERRKVAALLADEGTVEKVAEELSAHDDLPGWTCDDDDRLVYECLCGDRSPVLDQDYIGPDDAETAGAWHRAHVARAALAALAGLIGGEGA